MFQLLCRLSDRNDRPLRKGIKAVSEKPQDSPNRSIDDSLMSSNDDDTQLDSKRTENTQESVRHENNDSPLDDPTSNSMQSDAAKALNEELPNEEEKLQPEEGNPLNQQGDSGENVEAKLDGDKSENSDSNELLDEVLGGEEAEIEEKKEINPLTSEEDSPSSGGKSQKVIDNINEMFEGQTLNLQIKESLKLKTLETKIHSSYYKRWSHEANQVLTRLVILRRRRSLIKSKQKA